VKEAGKGSRIQIMGGVGERGKLGGEALAVAWTVVH